MQILRRTLCGYQTSDKKIYLSKYYIYKLLKVVGISFLNIYFKDAFKCPNNRARTLLRCRTIVYVSITFIEIIFYESVSIKSLVANVNKLWRVIMLFCWRSQGQLILGLRCGKLYTSEPHHAHQSLGRMFSQVLRLLFLKSSIFEVVNQSRYANS